MVTRTLCECGCGGLPPLARWTDPRWGHIKGQPCRFLPVHTSRRKPPEVRFAAFVKPVESGCWEWQGFCLANGYGRFGLRAGKIVLAHRFAYEMANGVIPDGKMILHSCDNPPCVNPAHLSVGTHADNMHDMENRGRRAPGWNTFKTECLRGHPFDEKNTYLHGHCRHCRACRKISDRSRKAAARLRRAA